MTSSRTDAERAFSDWCCSPAGDALKCAPHAVDTEAHNHGFLAGYAAGRASRDQDVLQAIRALPEQDERGKSDAPERPETAGCQCWYLPAVPGDPPKRAKIMHHPPDLHGQVGDLAKKFVDMQSYAGHLEIKLAAAEKRFEKYEAESLELARALTTAERNLAAARERAEKAEASLERCGGRLREMTDQRNVAYEDGVRAGKGERKG